MRIGIRPGRFVSLADSLSSIIDLAGQILLNLWARLEFGYNVN